MAGAGFKTFNTGDVLTASDVNTYLMQQTVMVFASSAARTSALGANVAEGMLSYLKDTDQVEVYNGTSWVASDDPNAIQNSIFDAKGDLIVGTGNDTYVRQAIGSNGQTLIADSSQADGLQWGDNYGFTAGKNKIINGNFGIWQRGTSFSNPAGGSFLADRWLLQFDGSGATRTLSQQTFTAGTAPVSGYEGTFFLRWNQSVAGTGSTFNVLDQRIEDVRQLAGQTVTLSFWAKADATRNITPVVGQFFGSGGSSPVEAAGSAQTLTTSWARYSVTVSLPSIAGKTIASGNYLYVRFSQPVNTAMTIDYWGVQLEAGSVATSFQTATGTIQGELAACQRYYFRSTSGTAFGGFGIGVATATTAADIQLSLPVVMRAQSTTLEYSTLGLYQTGSVLSVTNLVINHTTSNTIRLGATVASGLTSGAATQLLANNSTSAYLGVSAEL